MWENGTKGNFVIINIMNARKFLNYSLIAAVLVFIGGAVWVVVMPGHTQFQEDSASFDTTSFQSYSRGRVVEVVADTSGEQHRLSVVEQTLRVELLTGTQTGQVVTTSFSRVGSQNITFKVGDEVVLGQLEPERTNVLLFDETEGDYVVVDRWRLPGVITVVVIFCALALLIGRRYGLRSLIGLAMTGIVLLLFTAPQLLQGKNAIAISILSAGVIGTLGLFLAHGYKERTKLAVFSTLVSLLVAIVLSAVFVNMAQLFGLGQSEAFTLQNGYLGQVDLKGLLFGGLVIALLGVLDDVTTTQTAAVAELHNADSRMNFKELFKSGMKVGQEHIASLINTLILVYVGASLPLLLLLVAGSDQPVWTLVNSEFMAEEIIRALAGSASLVIAVPIATIVAARYLTWRD